MGTRYIAKVIENNDSDIEGKIQIYIESLMWGITDTNLYPWARPISRGVGGSGTFGVSSIPEKDSLVWVEFEDEIYWRNAVYLGAVEIKQKHPHSVFDNDIKSNIEGGWASAYPFNKFVTLPNKVGIAMSSDPSNAEFAIFHPQASFYFNKTGEMFVKTNGNIKIVSGADLTLAGGGSDSNVEPTVLGDKLKVQLEALADHLVAETHGTGTGPSGPPLNSASYIAWKAQLITILSQILKNN
jgi:hypothetical protein